MAVVTMTLEEARKKWTPEKRKELLEALKDHVDVYDPECPPCTQERLARFRPAAHRRIKA